MKQLAFTLCFFVVALSGMAQVSYNPVADPAAVVESGNVRFTVLTDEMIRIQQSSSQVFEDRATFGIVNRNLPVPDYTVTDDGTYLYITTSALELRYRLGGTIRTATASPTVLQITLTMNGQQVVWYPGKDDAMNLKGTMRTLDNVSGDTGRSNLEDGVLSRAGWAIIDESPQTTRGDGSRTFPIEVNDEGVEWFSEFVDDSAIDWYFFGYGHDYKHAMGDFVKVAGKIPLPPKYMFGYWYSRYWAYTQDEFISLVQEMEQNDIPVDVMIMDMDWHLSGWTGWTWNTELIPNPDYLLKYMHQHNLKVALNVHPAEGVASYEDYYAEIRDELGYPSTYTDNIPWKIEDYAYYKAIFSHIIRAREAQGVDFWWIDWQQWLTSNYTDGLGETFLNNYVFWNDMVRERSDHRPVIYHRWGGLGSHRYEIGFSGDTYANWATLKYQPSFTSNASNVGYGYWGHDLGGHMYDPDNDPERYLRWMQFGVFTPIFRTHATNDPSIERRIWMFPNFEQLRATVVLRYALFPYIYTSAREAYDTGVCINRPLYYDYPEESNAYTYEDEYMFGDNILVAPITSEADAEGLAKRTTWLPQGKWWDVAKSRLVEGNTTFVDSYTLDEIPYFYKAGAVVVNYPKQNTVQTTPNVIILQCAPGGEGEGSFYEDSGDNADYDQNYTTTAYSYACTDSSATLLIGAREGMFEDMPTVRTYQVELYGAEGEPTAVSVNGAAYNDYEYDSACGVITISIPMESLSEGKTIYVEAPFTSAISLDDVASTNEEPTVWYPQLWIAGSAVIDGVQPLETYPNNEVKFHGRLQPGELYIIDTEGIVEGTTHFYTPNSVNANIVNSGTGYTVRLLQDDAAWAVDFAADNYRFTVDMTNRSVRGELYISPIELYIGGGCVAAEQSDQWHTEYFEAMNVSDSDKNVWSWTGELKAYEGNVEPKRFKLMAQKDWNPVSLHPYTQDESVLSSTQLNSADTGDYKWAIPADGYYHIVVDTFRETISTEYLGSEEPSGIELRRSDRNEDSATDTLYNIAGQRVDDTYHGIVISNKKKALQ